MQQIKKTHLWFDVEICAFRWLSELIIFVIWKYKTNVGESCTCLLVCTRTYTYKIKTTTQTRMKISTHFVAHRFLIQSKTSYVALEQLVCQNPWFIWSFGVLYPHSPLSTVAPVATVITEKPQSCLHSVIYLHHNTEGPCFDSEQLLVVIEMIEKT